MNVPTFYPPVNPSPGGRRNYDFKLLEAEFGDGYSQVAPRGLNHMRRKISLSWEALTQAQWEEIVGFLEERQGCEPFMYIPYGETEPMFWTCKQWDHGTNSGVWTVSAEFVQDFNLG